ncbi:hypothetical protein, partial [Morganella morganii]|uniref:hypothetical protein n=1 Tax=Morganella morganii TaxID=582 RepID=UPI001FFDA4C8
SAFLNGMVLALVVHKTDDEGDSLNITSDKLITVDKNKPDLEWSVETDVAVGHRFTLEIVLENLKNIRAVSINLPKILFDFSDIALSIYH